MNRQDLIRRLRDMRKIDFDDVFVNAADALEQDEAILKQALLLVEWIRETPHQRGSINGLAGADLGDHIANFAESVRAWRAETHGGVA